MKKYFTKDNIIQWLLIVIIISLLLFFVFRSSQRAENPNLSPDSRSVQWNGNQTLPQIGNQSAAGIIIPGFNELTFISGQKNQKVNFYNPQENNCYFQMSLFVDDSLYWQSELVQPGHGFYEIDLINALEAGCYNGCLRIECYGFDGSTMNAANVHFALNVK